MTLMFDLLTTKSTNIVYGSWPFMNSRKVYLDETGLKLIIGQYFAYAGQTDGQADDVRHNIIRPKVPSRVYKTRGPKGP